MCSSLTEINYDDGASFTWCTTQLGALVSKLLVRPLSQPAFSLSSLVSSLSLSLSLSLLVSLPTLFIPFTSLHYLQMSWPFHFIRRQSRLFVKSFLAAGINCEGCAPSPGATTQQQCSGCESAEAAHLSTCFLSFLSFSLSLWVLFFSLFVTFYSLDLLKNTVFPIYSMENRACFWCVNYPTGINFEDRTPLPGALLKLSAPAAELLILSPVIPLEVDQWPGWEDLRPSCAFRVWLVLASLRKYREFFFFTLSNSCRFSCLKFFADYATSNTQFIWKTFRAKNTTCSCSWNTCRSSAMLLVIAYTL